jgi:hypothetical protein
MSTEVGYDTALKDLRTRIVLAAFIKKDGTHRVMYATRNSSLIASLGVDSSLGGDVGNDTDRDIQYGNIRAFDTQVGEFRRINLKTLIHWEHLPITYNVPHVSENPTIDLTDKSSRPRMPKPHDPNIPLADTDNLF